MNTLDNHITITNQLDYKEIDKSIHNNIYDYLSYLYQQIGFSTDIINNEIHIYDKDTLTKIIYPHHDYLDFKNIKEILKKYKSINSSIFSIYCDKGYDIKLVSLYEDRIHFIQFEDIKDLIKAVSENDINKLLYYKFNLFNHNIYAYNNTQDLFNKYNRIAITQPTGTGKLYTTIKRLMYINNNFPHEKSLVLAPNHYALNTIKEKYKQSLNNIDFYTYQKLIYCSDEELKNMKYQHIFLDEFHRLGAFEWKQKLNTLLSYNRDAKILGNSATPIRNDGQDIKNIIFKDIMAKEMYLIEAIMKDILPNPIYISTQYDINFDIQKLIKDIEDSSLSENNKKTLIKETYNSKIDWEKSNGVQNIFNKYLDKKDSKYIIFCEDINHLNKMINIVKNYFELTKKYKKINTFDIHMNKSDLKNKKAIQEFSKHHMINEMNLLFTVNKLNESYHIEGVDGVFLFRKTQSIPLFLQQIGRAFSSDSKKQPKIFDMIGNIENVNENIYINLLNKEIKKENKKRVNLAFPLKKEIPISIIDNCSSINIQFNNIRKRITSNAFNRLISFYKKYNREPEYSKESSLRRLYLKYLNNSYNKSYFGNSKFTNYELELLSQQGYNIKPLTKEEILTNELIEFIETYGKEPIYITNPINKSEKYERKLRKKYLKYYKNYLKNCKILNNNIIDNLSIASFSKESVIRLSNSGYIFDHFQNPADRLIIEIDNFKKEYNRYPNAKAKNKKHLSEEFYKESILYGNIIRMKSNTLNNKYIGISKFKDKHLKKLNRYGYSINRITKKELKENFIKDLINYSIKYNEIVSYNRNPKTLQEKESQRLSSRFRKYLKKEKEIDYIGFNLFTEQDKDLLEEYGYLPYIIENKDDFLTYLIKYLEKYSLMDYKEYPSNPLEVKNNIILEYIYKFIYSEPVNEPINNILIKNNIYPIREETQLVIDIYNFKKNYKHIPKFYNKIKNETEQISNDLYKKLAILSFNTRNNINNKFNDFEIIKLKKIIDGINGIDVFKKNIAELLTEDIIAFYKKKKRLPENRYKDEISLYKKLLVYKKNTQNYSNMNISFNHIFNDYLLKKLESHSIFIFKTESRKLLDKYKEFISIYNRYPTYSKINKEEKHLKYHIESFKKNSILIDYKHKMFFNKDELKELNTLIPIDFSLFVNNKFKNSKEEELLLYIEESFNTKYLLRLNQLKSDFDIIVNHLILYLNKHNTVHIKLIEKLLLSNNLSDYSKNILLDM